LDAAIDLDSEIKDALMHLNSTRKRVDEARMTGTGCCVFVAFEKEKDALKAKQELPSKWTGFVAQAINKSPL
jgi:4-diphosphocytidyl-2-C-methyl-D-erythritol kinase